MMNQEIKAKWVEALRSGEYKQGVGRLRMVDTNTGEDMYCCLGVLCDLAVKEGAIPAPEDITSSNGCTVFKYGDRRSKSISTLSFTVQDWAGLSNENPVVPYGSTSPWGEPEVHNLASLNDGGTSFNEIAYLIENYL